MKKFVAVYTATSLLVLLIASQAADHSENGDGNDEQSLLDEDYDESDDPTDAELELKRVLSFVTPLMAILRSEGQRRSNRRRSGRMYDENESQEGTQDDMVEEGRARGRRPPYSNSVDRTDRYGDYPSASGYGGGYGGGGGGYGGGYYGCCNKKDDLLPILALVALSLLLLYLIAIATTTTTGKRRKRSWDEDGNLIDEQVEDIELLDAPTWISMVNQIWNADDLDDSDSCTLKALCRMNHLALSSPGSSGVMVSLSSIPLSYLLHRRHHDEGFMRYLDASLLGHGGVNCTNVFSRCSRLN